MFEKVGGGRISASGLPLSWLSSNRRMCSSKPESASPASPASPASRRWRGGVDNTVGIHQAILHLGNEFRAGHVPLEVCHVWQAGGRQGSQSQSHHGRCPWQSMSSRTSEPHCLIDPANGFDFVVSVACLQLVWQRFVRWTEGIFGPRCSFAFQPSLPSPPGNGDL